jgi:hypothetical protein
LPRRELQDLEIRRLLREGGASNLAAVRGLALQAYLDKENSYALEIYQELLAVGFEEPSMRIHMVRVLVTTGHMDAAQEHVRRAEEIRDRAPVYVQGRIAFFAIAFCWLRGEKADLKKADSEILWLKSTLEDGNSMLDWHIERVLDRLKPQLPGEKFRFLEALAGVLSARAAVVSLKAFSAW